MTAAIDTVKPVVMLVDDEPNNLFLLENTLLPFGWKICAFDQPLEALQALTSQRPWVIVSDQRMPGMTGLEFLKIASQILPESLRIVVTGQSDDEVILRLINEAAIFGFVTKPWNVDVLCERVRKATEFFQAMQERQHAFAQIAAQKEALELEILKHRATYADLLEARQRESQMVQEYEGWIPWPIVDAIKQSTLKVPTTQPLALLTFDIVDSSRLASVQVDGAPVRSQVIRLFRDQVIQNGGMKESQAGDASFAHFGAFGSLSQPAVAALHAAREFRVKLRSFSMRTQVPIECGLALHHADEVIIDVDVVRAQLTGGRSAVEKTLHSQSSDIDLVHRMEKLAHSLPGSNIIASDAFLAKLPTPDPKFEPLGAVQLRGQTRRVALSILRSDRVTNEMLDALRKELERQDGPTFDAERPSRAA